MADLGLRPTTGIISAVEGDVEKVGSGGNNGLIYEILVRYSSVIYLVFFPLIQLLCIEPGIPTKVVARQQFLDCSV